MLNVSEYIYAGKSLAALHQMLGIHADDTSLLSVNHNFFGRAPHVYLCPSCMGSMKQRLHQPIPDKGYSILFCLLF